VFGDPNVTTTIHPPADATQLLTPRPDDLARSWERQRMLRIGEDVGWYQYLAGDPVGSRYVLKLTTGQVRVLHRDTLLRTTTGEVRRDEPVAWVCGQAFGRNAFGVLDRIGPMPRLYDRPTVSTLLDMTKPTVNAHTRAGHLRALYYARHRRHYYADQIDGMLGDTAAQARWEDLRFLLPNTIRPDQIHFRESPSPEPLPIPEITHDLAGERNMHALHTAEHHGWLQYIARNKTAYTIIIGGIQLDLPSAAILPFVWGVGDAHGQGDRVAYR
jgi:hypothetical protein